MITVEHIQRHARVARRNSGLWAAFSSLGSNRKKPSMLEDISLHNREGETWVGYRSPAAPESSTVKTGRPASWFRQRPMPNQPMA